MQRWRNADAHRLMLMAERSCSITARRSSPSSDFSRGLARLHRGESPGPADAMETTSSGQDGLLAYGGADPRRASRG